MLDRLSIKYFKLAVGLDNIRKETDVDISARCPVCGDSRTNKRKARLHLYNKGPVTNVSCFNGDCPVHNKTVYSFLKDFFPSLLGNYKRENFGNTVEKLANGEHDVFSNFKKDAVGAKTADILTQDLSPYFKDLKSSPEGLEYLKNRGFNYKEQYGKWYFGIQDLKIGEILYKVTDSIIIPLYFSNEMYGFYSRNIYNKTFYTYMHDHNVGYKIWNWFKIDTSQPVYVFEGIFDAIASRLPNSIALMGAKLPEERLKELLNPIFVLDNDKTGLINSLSYSKNHLVYVQPDNYKEKDMNELVLNHKDVMIHDLVNRNLYQGISAEVRIKAKL